MQAYQSVYRTEHRETLLSDKRKDGRIHYAKNRAGVLKKQRARYAASTPESRKKKSLYSKAYRQANLERVKRWQKTYRDKHPEKTRSKHLHREYGIDLKTYEKMAFEQGGVCHICKKPETFKMKGIVIPLSVDHCHLTGRIRKLLCRSCNFLLGHAKDGPAILRLAAQYLEEENQNNGGKNGKRI